MRFLAWDILIPSPELKTLQERKTDRFRENRMSLGRLSFRGPRDLLPQNSLNLYKVKTLYFEKKSEKKLSRKGTTQEKKSPDMNVLFP